MRKVFLTAFLINVVLLLAAFFVLPDRVAIHFNLAGQPDNWGPKSVLLLVLLAVQAPLFLLFWFAPALTLKIPGRLVNLPNKDYWLAEENRPKTRAVLARLLSEMGTVLFLFMFWMDVLVVAANMPGKPAALNARFMAPALVVFVLYSLLWCVQLFRAFRRPADAPPAAAP